MGATSPPGPDECCLHKTAYAREELSDYDALEVNRQTNDDNLQNPGCKSYDHNCGYKMWTDV